MSTPMGGWTLCVSTSRTDTYQPVCPLRQTYVLLITRYLVPGAIFARTHRQGAPVSLVEPAVSLPPCPAPRPTESSILSGAPCILLLLRQRRISRYGCT